jgi:uncharacterized glyoxalase superfamily protein PhnB
VLIELTSEVQAVNLSPFLLFEGNCAEAMQFYQSCLGGESEVTLSRDTPMKDQTPASPFAGGKVLTWSLRLYISQAPSPLSAALTL